MASVLACLLWVAACSVFEERGGGGTDVPDSFTTTFNGRVFQQDGKAASGAVARIRPEHWTVLSGQPSGLWETRADKSGYFSLSFPDTGRWTLEVFDSTRDQGRFLSFRADTILPASVDSIQLADHGSLSGYLPPDSSSLPTKVVLQGTDRAVVPDSNGTWSFDTLAPGTYQPAVIFPTNPNVAVPLVPIEVISHDTAVAGAAPTAGNVAGRILPAMGWSTNPSSVNGWVVVEQSTGFKATTDGSGGFTLPKMRGKAIRVIATDPISGVSVKWDTTTTFDTASTTLRTRVASATSSVVWKELQAVGSDGIRRRAHVRVLPDSSGLKVVANIAQADTSIAMNGWTDDSGRFALPVDTALPCHVTVTDSVTGDGAVFPWGGKLDGAPASTIALGQPVTAGITLHFPFGYDAGWKGTKLSVSLLGAGIAQPQTTTERITVPKLFPGKYRMAVARYVDGEMAPGRVDFSVVAGSPRELDTTLSQDALEDTTKWMHSIKIQIDPGLLTQTLHGVAVRVVLDQILDWGVISALTTAGNRGGQDFKYYDETGRWIPANISSWDEYHHQGAVMIYLDSLAPGQPREILLRYDYLSRTNIYLSGSSIVEQKFIYTKIGGYLASYMGCSSVDATSNASSPLHSGVSVPGASGWMGQNAWEITNAISMNATQPTAVLGTAFGVQTVFQLTTGGADTGTLVSLAAPGEATTFVSLKMSGGKPVLRTDINGSMNEFAMSPSPIPLGTWLVAQLRRVGDSLAVDLRDPNANTTQSIGIPVAWPTGNDSLTALIGSPASGVPGFDGMVQSVEFHDGTWTQEAAEFSTQNWADMPKNVSLTSLK